MTTNMGNSDRAIRLVAGVVLLLLAFATNVGGQGLVHWAMILIGAVLAGTAAVGNCPAYSVFGITTCRKG